MLSLRRAHAGDWARLYYWRNDPRTRASFIKTRPVKLAEHMKWLSKTLESDSCVLFVAEDSELESAVGTCRLDLQAGRTRRFAECSITIDPLRRGRGYASRVLNLMVGALPAEWACDAIRAIVKSDNAASVRAFAESGFALSGREKKGLVTLELSVKANPR